MAKLSISMEAVPYVLKFERESGDEKTIWHIRPLTFKERAKIQDEMIVTEMNMAGPKNQVNRAVMRHLSGTQVERAIQICLTKIENLRDKDGQLVKFDENSNGGHKEEILNRIPAEWLQEVANEIFKISGLTKEETKN